MDIELRDMINDVSKRHGTDNLISYSFAFLDRADKTSSSGVKADLSLLAAVTNPILRSEDARCPYVPQYSSGDGRQSPVPDDLSEAQLARLAELLQEIKDIRLSARIADVLWIRKFGKACCQTFRRKAIESYLSVPLETEVRWSQLYRNGFERAATLAKEGKDEDYLREISKKAQDILFGRCHTRSKCAVAVFLLDYNLPDVDAGRVVACLKEGMKQEGNDILSAGEYHDAIAKWMLRQKDNKGANDEIVDKAKQVVAWIREQGPQLDPGIAEGQLEPVKKALYNLPRAYKEASGIETLIAEVDSLLATVYQKAYDNMGHIKVEMTDPTEQIRKAKEAVRGKNLNETLTYFIARYNFHVDSLSSVKGSPILSLFPMTQVDDHGRPVVREDGSGPGSEKGSPYLRRQCYMMQIRNVVEGTLRPIHGEIRERYNLAPKSFESLVKQSSFVPKERRGIVAKGLFYGYNADYETACYVLLPQLECILRKKLEDSGVETRVKNADPVKEGELSLSSLVKGCDKVFNEDLAFEMKALFAPAPELNLRNAFLHGEIPDCNHSEWPFYVWWLIFKQVCLGSMQMAA